MADAQTSLTQANKLIKNPGTSQAGLRMSVKLLEDSKQGLSSTQVDQVDSVIRNVNRMISRRVGVPTAEAAAPPPPRVPVAPAKSVSPLEPAISTALPKRPGLTLLRTEDGSRTINATDEEIRMMESGEIPKSISALIERRREQTLATERPGFFKTFLGELGGGATQVGKGLMAITATPPTEIPPTGEALEVVSTIAQTPVGLLRMIGALPVATSEKTAELIERQSIEAGLAPGPAKTVADTSGMLTQLILPQKVIIGPYRFVANQLRAGLLAAKGGARAVLQPIIRAMQRRPGTTSVAAGEDFIKAVAAKETELRAQVGGFIEGGWGVAEDALGRLTSTWPSFT